jgi:hypothetical protein
VTSGPVEPTLADVQREYPAWYCWRAVSGLYYARPATAEPGDPTPVKGEDALDLRDQIRCALAQHEPSGSPETRHHVKGGGGQEC